MIEPKIFHEALLLARGKRNRIFLCFTFPLVAQCENRGDFGFFRTSWPFRLLVKPSEIRESSMMESFLKKTGKDSCNASDPVLKRNSTNTQLGQLSIYEREAIISRIIQGYSGNDVRIEYSLMALKQCREGVFH